MKQYAIYLRVSTQKQGNSGLSLENQQKVCKKYISDVGGEFVAEFKDIESGTHRDRKGLNDALLFCKKNGCGLVFSKLDRLARDVEFCFKVINTGVDVHFCDLPQLNTLLLGIFATVGQYERELVSSRTKQALSVKKSHGCKLGASNEKYKETYYNKTYLERREFGKKRGATKSCRYKQSRDVVAFLRILKTVFPSACTTEDAAGWDWSQINSKGDNKNRILSLISDYKSIDESGTLFCKWEIDKWDDTKKQVRLCSTIGNIRKSFLNQKKDDVI
jgi:DNA invertase Pin-like site-specific DNA recombinase